MRDHGYSALPCRADRVEGSDVPGIAFGTHQPGSYVAVSTLGAVPFVLAQEYAMQANLTPGQRVEQRTLLPHEKCRLAIPQ